MAISTPTPTRRAFLSGSAAAAAGVSIAAVPVVMGSMPDAWGKLSSALALVNPKFSDAVDRAREAGMKPEWIYSIVNTGSVALLFSKPDGGLATIYAKLKA